jgi:hypothetical protein
MASPVVNRIDWVIRQIHMGRKVHVAIGQAKDIGKFKVKIILQPPSLGAADNGTVFGVTSMLTHIRKLVIDHSAMDRGHKHSSGVSEIAIWIKPFITPGASAQASANLVMGIVDKDISGGTAAPASSEPQVTVVSGSTEDVTVAPATAAATSSLTASEPWEASRRESASVMTASTDAAVVSSRAAASSSYVAGQDHEADVEYQFQLLLRQACRQDYEAG